MMLLNQFVLFSLAITLKSAVAPATAKPASSESLQQQRALRRWRARGRKLFARSADVPAGSSSPTTTSARISPLRRRIVPWRAPITEFPTAIIANNGYCRHANPLDAGRLLAGTGADYVLDCRPMDKAQLARVPAGTASLLARLAAGQCAGFPDTGALWTDAPLYRMWRVIEPRSLAQHLERSAAAPSRFALHGDFA